MTETTNEEPAPAVTEEASGGDAGGGAGEETPATSEAPAAEGTTAEAADGDTPNAEKGADGAVPVEEDKSAAAGGQPGKLAGVRNAFAKMGTTTKTALSGTKDVLAAKTTQLVGTMKEKGTETTQKLKEGVKTTIEKGKEMTKKPESVVVSTEEEGMDKLKQMVEAAKEKRRPEKWSFATAPLASFEKETDDLLMAFVRWSKRSADNVSIDDSLETESKYDITKAFNRLESYANWMDKQKDAIAEPPVTTESIQETWKIWNMKVSYDKENRLVWWMDLDSMDPEEVKKLNVNDSLRLFVWFAHFVLLDQHAQQQGMVMVQNLGKKNIMNHMSLIPPKLMVKIDRLTNGTMPVKTKQLYMVRSPQWAKVVMGLVQPFLSAKMKQRIVTLEDAKFLQDLLGVDCIPTEFEGCEGKLENDVVWATYFANAE